MPKSLDILKRARRKSFDKNTVTIGRVVREADFHGYNSECLLPALGV